MEFEIHLEKSGRGSIAVKVKFPGGEVEPIGVSDDEGGLKMLIDDAYTYVKDMLAKMRKQDELIRAGQEYLKKYDTDPELV